MKKNQEYYDLIAKINESGKVDTNSFVRLLAKLGDFTIADAKIIKGAITDVFELAAESGWELSVPSVGVMRRTVFPPKTKMIPSKDENGKVEMREVQAKAGERLSFTLSKNIREKARERIRKEYD